MKRLDEKTISMGIGRKFIKSNNGNMMLTRSLDLSIVSLSSFDKFEVNGNYFSIKAWSVNLESFGMPVEINDNLNIGINEYF
jgi:hypothetical protein